jgi:hypothetical protein
MTYSRDQAYGDALYRASDAVLEPGGSKMCSFVCGDKESDQGDACQVTR